MKKLEKNLCPPLAPRALKRAGVGKQSALLIGLLLSACTLAPSYERPTVDAPAWRQGASETPTEIPSDWWKKFNSEELNQLVDQSLKANTDLQASLQRIEQSRAQRRIARSALYPSVDATGSYNTNTVDRSSNDGTTKSYRAGISASYELDLFGRNRANAMAAGERFEASKFDHDALALIVTSDTASVYAQLLSTEDRIAIAQKNLENSKQVMKIIQARYDAGRTSGLELAQQKTSLANTETGITNLIQQRDLLRSQLALLNGKPAQSFNVAAQTLDGFVIPEIAPGQPSELLERRPDIRNAESILKAANIDIGAARAEYFPSLDIGLSAALAATPASAPATLTTGIVGSALAPIFHGGAIDANVEQTKARKEELVANYRGVVLNAFREVEDALAAAKAATARAESLKVAAGESQKAYNIAYIRFKEGSTDYQTLLDTERALFSAEDALFSARFDQVSAAVDLYKTLGGGWKE